MYITCVCVWTNGGCLFDWTRYRTCSSQFWRYEESWWFRGKRKFLSTYSFDLLSLSFVSHVPNPLMWSPNSFDLMYQTLWSVLPIPLISGDQNVLGSPIQRSQYLFSPPQSQLQRGGGANVRTWRDGTGPSPRGECLLQSSEVTVRAPPSRSMPALCLWQRWVWCVHYSFN